MERACADRRARVAAHLGLGDLNAAFVANDAPVLHTLVLAAQAFPIGDRTEDLGAEQPVALRLKGAIVDRLRLRHLAVLPRHDLLRRRETDPDCVEVHGQRATIGKARSHGVLSSGSAV